MSATYRVPISADLLDRNPDWSRAGLRLIDAGPRWADGYRLAEFYDPGAPGCLNGEGVSPTLRAELVPGDKPGEYVYGLVTITEYWVLDSHGQQCVRVPPLRRLG